MVDDNREVTPFTGQEAVVKHLELVQAVINRLAGNAFLFKGWAITIAAGLSAFAAASSERAALVVACVASSLFWGLDGYYLFLELRYRDLYDAVRLDGSRGTAFQLSLTSLTNKTALLRWLKACRRPSVSVFYLAMILVDLTAVAATMAGVHHVG